MMVLYSIVLVIALVLILPCFIPLRRQALISQMIRQLQQLGAAADGDRRYAVNANIAFLRASRWPLGLLAWGLFRRPRLDPAKVLELADFEVAAWELELYRHLNIVEKRPFPGLLKPLRDSLLRLAQAGDSRTFLDVGCGAMEPALQTIAELARRGDHTPRVFVGVDLSDQALAAIQRNFAGTNIKVLTPRRLHLPTLIKRAAADKSTIVAFCRSDALALKPKDIGAQFDVIYSSKFRHHLTAADKQRYDRTATQLGATVLEFDDYQHNLTWLPPAITAWSRVVLLNGALLSQVRQPSKRELQQTSQAVHFFNPPGSYIKVLKGEL